MAARVAAAAFPLVVAGGLVACTAAAPVASAPIPTNDPRVLAADLNARLDALQRQSEPASDDVIASLERTLREQRERRARAAVAAGTSAVIPSSAGMVLPSVTPAPPPAPVAAASAPVKPVKMTKAQARAASAAAARQASAARHAAQAQAAASPLEAPAAATPLRQVEPLPAPVIVATTAATVTGPARAPMSRIAESRQPVEELYARGQALELQGQTVPAIGLYREASQRGHAPSSRRLMELYADGAPGVARDYRVAVFFKERAVQQGVSFEPLWRR